MATITSLLLPAHGSSQRGRAPYMVQKTIDLTYANILEVQQIQMFGKPGGATIQKGDGGSKTIGFSDRFE